MRWRRDSAPVPASEPRDVACCFCGDGIAVEGHDPLALNIVEQWKGGCDEPADSTLYAHSQCLVARLDPGIGDIFEF